MSLDSSQSFGKEFRLRSKSDFNYLRNNSLSVKSPLIRVVYKKSQISSTLTRVGFAISKKCGKAAQRNRAKRVLREWFRKSKYKEIGQDCLIILNCHRFKELTNKVEREDKLIDSISSCFQKISHA